MIGIWLCHLASKFEFEVPEITTILRNCEISEVRNFKSFFCHSDQVLTLRVVWFSFVCLEVFDDSNAHHSVSEFEVLELISKLV